MFQQFDRAPLDSRPLVVPIIDSLLVVVFSLLTLGTIAGASGLGTSRSSILYLSLAAFATQSCALSHRIAPLPVPVFSRFLSLYRLHTSTN